MKLLLSVTAAAFFTTNSLALPTLIEPEIYVSHGPPLAAVQPTADISFKYSSCAKRNWDLEKASRVTAEGNSTEISLTHQDFDCFGPTIEREYKVQISSDTFADGQFVLLNPSVPKVTAFN